MQVEKTHKQNNWLFRYVILESYKMLFNIYQIANFEFRITIIMQNMQISFQNQFDGKPK